MARICMVFVSDLLNASGQDLPDILACALANPQTSSMGSMLLFAAGSMMQVIEGEADAARAEWTRLLHSPYYRHSILLNEETVATPCLSGVSLGALQLAHAVIAQLPPAVAYFRLSESAIMQRVQQGLARNLLKQFAADYS